MRPTARPALLKPPQMARYSMLLFLFLLGLGLSLSCCSWARARARGATRAGELQRVRNQLPCCNPAPPPRWCDLHLDGSC
jgi:hypothetical protein